MEMEGNAPGIAPFGLQDILNRLAVVALRNKPISFYECFAEALERDVIRRTLLEIQADQYKSDSTDNSDVLPSLVSPRNCVRCGQAMTGAQSGDSTDTDADFDRVDEPACVAGDHQRASGVVSERSLVSSRSSTPRDGLLQPAALSESDEECVSLLSSDVGAFSSSDDLDDSEYVSAIEVPEVAQPRQAVDGKEVTLDGRDSINTFHSDEDPDLLGSTGDAGDEVDPEFEMSSLDDEDGGLDMTLALQSGADLLQESSNSASTLLDDAEECPQDIGFTAVLSSTDGSDDEENGGALTSDDEDDDDGFVASTNSVIEPLLPAPGDSDSSDAN